MSAGIVTRVVIAFLLMANGSGATDTPYNIPGTDVSIVIPDGWQLNGANAIEAAIEVQSRHADAGLTYHRPPSGKLTVDTLMGALQTGVVGHSPDAQLVKTVEIDASGRPGRLVFYNAPGMPGPFRWFTGCVIVDGEAVSITGLVFEDTSHDVIARVLRSVRKATPSN